jgi:hypothetical protein
MEDVADAGPWDLDRYRRAAVALGRLAGSWPEERATLELGLARRPLERLFFGKIAHVDLRLQAEDDFWLDPAVASAVDDRHRADLARLAEVVPELLERATRLPHGLAHGDAAPDNLREPGDGSIVAVDWSYGSIAALGADLGQLLAGRIESGAVDNAPVGDIADVIFDGYLDGLDREGCAAERGAVEEAWATHLAVRTVFSALVVDHRPDLDDAGRRELLARRAALGRFGLDLVARVSDRRGSR